MFRVICRWEMTSIARLLFRQRSCTSFAAIALTAALSELMALSNSMNTSIADDAVMIC